MINCINIRSVIETGKSIRVPLAKMKRFIGCNIFMLSLEHPRLRMFLANTAKVALISSNYG